MTLIIVKIGIVVLVAAIIIGAKKHIELIKKAQS